MANFVRTLAATAAVACMVPSASAAVLNFDDLPGNAGPLAQYFTTPYQGLSFGNLNPLTNDWGWQDSNPFPYTPKTAPNVVATDVALYTGAAFEESSKVTSVVDFTFAGAWFAGFPTNLDNSAAQVEFKLYNNNVLVHTSALLTLSGTPGFLATGYAGLIDAFSVNGPQGYYVMDNADVTPVPEPGTYALMIAGLAVVGLAARRRKSNR